MNLKIAILGLLLTIPVVCVNPQVEPKPEKAIESTYYDVPLDSKLQDFIIQTCEEHHISPALVIAMGVDLLAELYGMNPDTYWVLMAYNGGTDYANNMMEANTYSTYAVEVSAMAAELEGE